MIKLKYKGLSTQFVSKMLKESANAELMSEINSKFIPEYKNSIQKGLSPVQGFGRFKEYATSYKSQLLNKGIKAIRPISLYLTGEMQDEISTHKVDGNTVQIGISNGASEFVKTKAKAHNLGVSEKNIPVRRFIPQKGEELIITLQRKLRDIYARHLAKILKK